MTSYSPAFNARVVQVRSYSVPVQPGTLWTVFDWDGTTFRTINTVSGAAPPGTSAPFSGLLTEPLP